MHVIGAQCIHIVEVTLPTITMKLDQALAAELCIIGIFVFSEEEHQ